MKKIFIGLLFLLIGFSAFAETELITISRVRVFLDDVEISSEEFEEKSTVSAATVLSFTNLKPGKKMSLKALDKEIQQTQIRLINSGYFYNASIEIVPPRKNPEKRTIIINVTTGFLKRFGGGGIYGIAGKVALGGKRNQLLGVAGWNLNGVNYLDENLFDLPIIAGGYLYTNAPSCFTNKGSGVDFSGSATLGSLITPDLRFCVDTLGIINTSTGIVQNNFIVSPYLFYQHFFNNQIKTTTELRFYSKPIVSTACFSGELCQTLNYSPLERLNFGALLCGGVFLGNTYDSVFGHDLTLEHSAVSGNGGMGKRSIRSGYDPEELLVKNYVMASLEARIKVADFMIAKVFPCNIKPFGYVDLAYGQNSARDWSFLDAYGLGIQVNFDCPVFAYFNFAYGFNHLGKGKFCFYTGLNF